MQFGSLLAASGTDFQIQVIDMFEHDWTYQVLGHKIGCVDVAQYLNQWYHFLCALFLEPQAVHIDVTDLRKSLPVQNAFGCRGVQLQSNPDIAAEIRTQRLHAQTLARAADDSVEF